MSGKRVHRRAVEAEDEDEEEGYEQQLQRKLAAQRVAAAGKRPRSLAADGPLLDEEEDEGEEAFADEYVHAVPNDPGLYKDRADYARMQALSEFDREMELAERMDMRQRSLDQWERRREIAAEKRRAQRQAADAAAKKAKGSARAAARAAELAASAAEADAAPSLPDARQQLLAEMRDAREKRKAQLEAADGAAPPPKARRQHKRAAAEAGEEDEAEAADEAGAAADDERRAAAADDYAPAPRARDRRRSRLDEFGGAEEAEGEVEEAAPYEQLERIRLTRSRLEAWVEEPFFERTVLGCFVRVSIGQDQGAPIYRVAEVVGVSTATQPYALGSGKQTRTRLLLEIAGSRRDFRLTFVSNADFLPGELAKYARLQAERLLPRLKQRDLDAKLTQLLAAKQYVYNEQDIGRMVAKHLTDKQQNVGRAALRRAELLALREAAVEQGGAEGEAEMRRLDGLLGQIEQLAEESRRAQEASGAPPSASANSISAINQRNRTLERQGAETFASRKEDAVQDVNNPFARRETRPSMYWHVSAPRKKEEGGTTADRGGAGAGAAAEAAALGLGEPAEEPGAPAPGLAGADVQPSLGLVGAHAAVRLQLEIADAKHGAPPVRAAAQPGKAPLTGAAARSYAAWLSVCKVPVSAATKRMSLRDYMDRRDAVA